MHVDCNHFYHQSFLFLRSELLTTYCSDLDKSVGPWEKVWSIGLYPILFVTDNNWEYFGNICQHMQKNWKKCNDWKNKNSLKKLFWENLRRLVSLKPLIKMHSVIQMWSILGIVKRIGVWAIVWEGFILHQKCSFSVYWQSLLKGRYSVSTFYVTICEDCPKTLLMFLFADFVLCMCQRKCLMARQNWDEVCGSTESNFNPDIKDVRSQWRLNETSLHIINGGINEAIKL